MLQETTSRGLSGLVCPSRTSESGRGILCDRRRGEEKGSARRSVQIVRHGPGVVVCCWSPPSDFRHDE